MLHRILFDGYVFFIFLLMMSVLVTAHEFGHYLFARLCGMGVEEFAIGFGKHPLFTWFRKSYRLPVKEGEMDARPLKPSEGNALLDFASTLESAEECGERKLVRTESGLALEETTVFTVRPLPLGGFVRIKGMVPEEDGSEVKIPGGFYSKPPLKRLLVLFAGPLFSVLAGIIILIPFFMIVGKSEPDSAPVIGGIMQGGPADKAGLKPGDEFVEIGGRPIHRFYDAVLAIRDTNGKPTPIEVSREGKLIRVVATPAVDKTPTPVISPNFTPTDEFKIQSKLDIVPNFTTKKLGAMAATIEAWKYPVDTVAGLFSGLLHRDQLKDELGGPETMVKYTAAAVQSGASTVFQLAALVSISVGIMNLLPFPPLDGGQMVVALAELLRRGKRLSIEVQGRIVTAGFMIVAMLILTVIVVDLQKWSGPQAVNHKLLTKPTPQAK